MPTTRFCALIGVPERTWCRHQARARAGRGPKGRGRVPPGTRSATLPAGMPWPIRRGGIGRCGRCAATTACPCRRPACCGCSATRGCCWRRTTSENAASSPPNTWGRPLERDAGVGVCEGCCAGPASQAASQVRHGDYARRHTVHALPTTHEPDCRRGAPGRALRPAGRPHRTGRPAGRRRSPTRAGRHRPRSGPTPPARPTQPMKLGRGAEDQLRSNEGSSEARWQAVSSRSSPGAISSPDYAARTLAAGPGPDRRRSRARAWGSRARIA
jgi:hypothetical protein